MRAVATKRTVAFLIIGACVSFANAWSQETKDTQPLPGVVRAQALYQEGMQLLKEGKTKEAESKFSSVVLDYKFAKEWAGRSAFELGRLREAQEKSSDAIFDYKMVVTLGFADENGEPLRTGGWRYACLCAYYGQTTELAEDWLAKNPTADQKWIDEVKANLAYRAGRRAFDKSDFDAAIREFSQSRKLLPNSTLACESGFWLGYTYQRLNRDAEMVKSYRDLIHECPDHSRVPSALGYLIGYAVRAGDTKRAEEWIGLLRDKYSKSFEGRFIFLTLSDLRQKAGDLGGAEKALKEGLAFNQDNPDYTQQMWGRLGDFYRRNGRDQEALDAWQKSAENLKLRDAPGALLKIGDYWKEKEDYVRALTIFQDIVSRITLKAIPQRLYYRFSAQQGAGYCLRKLGRFNEAIELYQQALNDTRDDDEKVSAQLCLAETWFDMGEKVKAITAYKELLQKYPQANENVKGLVTERLKKLEG